MSGVGFGVGPTPRLRGLVAADEGSRAEEQGVEETLESLEHVGASEHRGAPEPVPGRGEEGECDLCARALGRAHRHMVDLEKRSILCACRPCALLFDRDAAGGGHYRLVPEDVRELDDLRIENRDWEAMGIPVELAFFFRNGEEDRVAAFYPSPMGATEARIGPDRWERLEEANPALRDLEVDVEALLVDRRTNVRRADPGGPVGWLVPIDACYRLVGLIRTNWKGLAGGEEVWKEIDEFFEDLARRASKGPTETPPGPGMPPGQSMPPGRGMPPQGLPR